MESSEIRSGTADLPVCGPAMVGSDQAMRDMTCKACMNPSDLTLRTIQAITVGDWPLYPVLPVKHKSERSIRDGFPLQGVIHQRNPTRVWVLPMGLYTLPLETLDNVEHMPGTLAFKDYNTAEQLASDWWVD